MPLLMGCWVNIQCYFFTWKNNFSLKKSMYRKLNILLFLLFSNLIADPKLFLGPSSADDVQGIYTNLYQYINESKSEIILAIHELELIQIANLLKQKAEEGVEVHVLLESKWVHHLENKMAWHILKNSKAKVYLDKQNNGLMHNKFVIRDEKFLFTGSVNFTLTGFFYNYNDALIIKNKKLANEYRNYFFQLIGLNNNHKRYQPHIVKTREVKYKAVFTGQNYSPIKEIVEEISSANHSIHFLIFVFSSGKISRSLSQKALEGHLIQGIFDNNFENENILRNWKIIPFQNLWKNGAKVKYDQEKAKLHHKCMLIAPHTVITGSFNYSKNAEKNNNENFLIIQSPKLYEQYDKYFKKLWKIVPEKTNYQRFIQTNQVKKIYSNYQNYFDEQIRDKYRELYKSLSKDEIQGVVTKVLKGNKLRLREEKTQLELDVNLCLVEAPERGYRNLTQEPLSSLAQQYLALIASGKKVIVHHIHQLEDEICGEVKLLSKNLAEEKSLNYLALLSGYNYLAKTFKKSLHSGGIDKEKLKKAALFGEYLREKKHKNDINIASFYQEHHSATSGVLWQHPEDFRKTLQDIQQQWIENILKLSHPYYEKGDIIANRKTGKYYLPNTRGYFNVYKYRHGKNYLFFKKQSAAIQCGFRLQR